MLSHPFSQNHTDNVAYAVDTAAKHAYFDETLRTIRTLIDVDMAGPELLSQFVPEVYLVIDTNVLLLHLDVVRQFVDDIEAQSLPLQVIIPTAVLSELDHQKNRPDLAWFARRATAWILDKARERRTVRGQRRDERVDAATRARDPARENDLLIADCAEHFARSAPGRAFLCSGDKNLCVECVFRGDHLQTVLAPAHSEWCSRDLMRAMFPAFDKLNKFATHKREYRPSATVRATPPNAIAPAAVGASELDEMDVDDEGAPEVMQPSHALDSLHLQIVEHFRALLLDLCLREGGPTLGKPAGAAARSAHAPSYARKPAAEWTAADCLEFLGTRKALPPSNPALPVFMARPYTARGARRGQDWPRQAWEQALGALYGVGAQWSDGAIGESVSVLPYHCERIFLLPMRPTGM